MPQVKDLISLIEEKHLNNLSFIQSEIQKKGGTSYIIGGSVRDLIMGKKPKDFDLTTSLQPLDIKNIFKRVVETGIKHGTVTILIGDFSYEITTFRKDQGYSDGRHPDKIEYGTSLEEDVLRRDFTMNSIALDIINDQLIDLQNGISDIQNKTIKTIGSPLERFTEDGLRPIRCIRFMTILGFKIEKNTYEALEKTKHITKKISTERFHDEILKILSSDTPENGIYELSKLKYFSLFWKLDIYENLYDDTRNLSLLKKTPISIRLGFILFVLLKDKDIDLKQLEIILKNLKFSNEISKFSLYYYSLIYKFISNNFLKSLLETPSLAIRIFFSDFTQSTGEKIEINDYTMGILSLGDVLLSKNEYKILNEEFFSLIQTNPPLTIKELDIGGTDLKENFPDLNNKEYGNILKKSLLHVLEFPNHNRKDFLIKFIRENFI